MFRHVITWDYVHGSACMYTLETNSFRMLCCNGSLKRHTINFERSWEKRTEYLCSQGWENSHSHVMKRQEETTASSWLLAIPKTMAVWVYVSRCQNCTKTLPKMLATVFTETIQKLYDVFVMLTSFYRWENSSPLVLSCVVIAWEHPQGTMTTCLQYGSGSESMVSRAVCQLCLCGKLSWRKSEQTFPWMPW